MCPGDSVTVKSSIPLFWVYFSLVLTSRDIVPAHNLLQKTIAEVYSQVILVAYVKCRH